MTSAAQAEQQTPATIQGSDSMSVDLPAQDQAHEQPELEQAQDGGVAHGQAAADAAAAGALQADGAANGTATLTVRALVSTKEAGVIIGKGGQNVAELREKSGVKAGVSKVIQGVHDRVLSITGSVEAIAKVRVGRSGPSSFHRPRTD